MHVSVEELNVNLIAAGSKTPVQIGIGVHAGIVVAGIFGDQSRLTATFVATDVNLAARLEHLTKSFGSKILASDAVIDQISPDLFAFRFVGKVQVEGSERQIEVYDVFNADALDVKIYKEETKERFETAVRLGAEDPTAALVALRAINEIAASRAISDTAVESRIVAALKDLEVDDNDEQESSMNEGGSSNNTNTSTPSTAAASKSNTYRKNSNSNGDTHNRQLASSPSSTGVLCFSKDGGIKSSVNRNSAAGSIPRAESTASLMGSEQPSGDVNNGNNKNNNVVNNSNNNNNNSDSSVIRQNRVTSSAKDNIANINNKQNLIVDVQDDDEQNEEHGYHHQQHQQVSSTSNNTHRQTHSTQGSIHSASVKTYAAAAPASRDITSSGDNEHDIITSNNNTKTEKHARGKQQQQQQQQQPQYPRRANPYKTDDMMTNDNNDDEEVDYYHNNDENSQTALPHGLPEQQQQGKSPLLRR